ncbi:DNA translocase FtsK [Hyphomicrobium sp.]|uniref:DNA translocase FtsK n=1 Tax=Hyphomicrobium sp. TaxID=82 RepID=UPI0025C367F1|nr:DNA translocase FtsK [Hyphomicrobium sp.]MCC7252537.1 DNA translocase FtsK [Hyphomicrobium sp.]
MPSATGPSISGLDRQRLLPAALEARLIGTLGRSCGLMLLVALAAVWLSLLSWSVADPSLTHATGGPIRNALGAPGAIVADLLLQTLGLASAVALLPLMLWAFELVLAEHVTSLRTKATYYPFAVLGVAAAVSAVPGGASWPIEHGLGGILGDVIFDAVTSVLGFISSDTAAIAAGILLAGFGMSSLVRALGVSRELVLPRRTPHATRHASWTQASWAHDATHALTARLPRPDSLAAALGNLRTLARPHFGRGHFGAVEPVLPGLFTRHAEPEPQAPAAYAPNYNARRPIEHDDLEPIPDDIDDFAADGSDPDLEISSRAIAERFAPPGARPLVPEPALPDHDLPRFLSAAREAATPAPAPQPVREPAPRPAAPARRPQTSLLRAVNARRAPPAFKRPSPAMLKKSPPSKAGSEFSQTVLRGTARLLEDVLADFGVKGEVRDIKPGPVVTLYELEPARGTKATRIMALADDIARSMSATSARVAVIPGRNVIGIELPNSRRETVGLRELLESPVFTGAEGILPLTLGRSIGGEPIVADLARMPHLLVAGTTGSGKSVGVNAMILSILFRHTPEECRFLMIDPKMLELSVYNGIPHLLTPVVTEPQKAVGALNWVVAEMEERYKRMAKLSVRNIEAFNTRVRTASQRGEQLARTVQTGFDAATGQPVYEREEMDLAPMPYIVVVVDEFADLMITAGKDIETAVQRLAQKARAAGIHLIMATQRPSVDIITGTIKANFPTRVSFRVASKIDSRTILNEQGAEQLLGQGDMLMTSGGGQLLRVHGPFVSDEEVEAVAAHLRAQGEPRYVESLADAQEDAGTSSQGPGAGGADDGESLYDRAVAVVLRDRKATTSYVQRRLSIGYNRAADLIERMEQDGLISAPNHTGRREILAGETQGRSVA